MYQQPPFHSQPPQVATTWQLVLQPSLLFRFPSSQASTPARTIPSPQRAAVQLLRPRRSGSGCRHRRLQPLPGPNRRRSEPPCSCSGTRPVWVWLPSSRASTPAWTKPSPQRAAVQLLRHASVWVWLPSSQASTLPGQRRHPQPSRRAVVEAAASGLGLVAVVAGFNPCLDKSVTAASRRAVVEARVGLGLVAVVAGFNPCLDKAVTAASAVQLLRPRPVWVWLPSSQPQPLPGPETVTAACSIARVEARPSSHSVTVITSLHAGTERPVAAETPACSHLGSRRSRPHCRHRASTPA